MRTSGTIWGTLTVLGSGLWLLSEALERANGAIYPVSMAILSAGLLVLAVAIWVLHAHQRRVAGWPSLVGAFGISLGCLCLALVDLRGLHFGTIAEVNAHSPVLFNAGLIGVVVGTFAFGWSILRHRAFPAWTGVFVILSTCISFAVEIARLPDVGVTLANVILNVALITMGWTVVRSTRA